MGLVNSECDMGSLVLVARVPGRHSLPLLPGPYKKQCYASSVGKEAAEVELGVGKVAKLAHSVPPKAKGRFPAGMAKVQERGSLRLFCKGSPPSCGLSRQDQIQARPLPLQARPD